jgi:diguanylate cyclase (GGDEF)-like protein
MQIDAFTVLLAGLIVKGLLCALFLVYWLRDRRSTWYLWFCATFLFGEIATLMFLARGFTPELFAVGAAVAFLIAAFACCWQGARAFGRRPPLWTPVVVLPCLWLAVCAVPGVVESVRFRLVGSSIIVASFLGLSAWEFWRGRSEPLPSRWPIMVVFGSLALFFASRIALMEVLPFPFGALPTQPGHVAAFNLIIFCHVLVLTVLVVALSKERLELIQRTRAQTDPLTGAFNRRAFLARGIRLLKRHQFEKAALSLLFLDLDHFKSLNDRFGHLGGDDVLVRFVTLVNENIRPTDFLFRLGGEEFCCLLPHTATEQALRVAERIRYQFERATVTVAGYAVQSTVSIGVASTQTFGYDLETLMRQADQAVYAAKRQGRNRVKLADPEEPAESEPQVRFAKQAMAAVN